MEGWLLSRAFVSEQFLNFPSPNQDRVGAGRLTQHPYQTRVIQDLLCSSRGERERLQRYCYAKIVPPPSFSVSKEPHHGSKSCF